MALGISSGVHRTRSSSVRSIILIGLLSSTEGCSSRQSRMHCTTAFISPFSLLKRAASFTSEADGKTFFKLCSFSSKSGEADLDVDIAGGWISGCKSGGGGGQFLSVSGLQLQHFPLLVASGEVL